MFFGHIDLIVLTNKKLISSRYSFGPLAITLQFARRRSRRVLGLPKRCEQPPAEQPLIAEIDGGRPATMFMNRDRGESRGRILSFFSSRSWLIQNNVWQAARDSLHRRSNIWQFTRRFLRKRARPDPGGHVHRRNLPRGKFEPVAGNTIAPYRGSFEIQRAAQNRCNWLFLDGGALGP